MNMASVKAWISQPSTITGLGVAAGTISGLVAHVITHDATLSAGVAGSIIALVHVAIPDNSAAETSIDTLVRDVVNAAVQRRLAASLPALLADASAAVQAVVAHPAPVVVAPVAVPVVAQPAVAPAAAV